MQGQETLCNVESQNGIQEVDGSIPSGSTNQNNGLEGVLRDAFSVFATILQHLGSARLIVGSARVESRLRRYSSSPLASVSTDAAPPRAL